MPPPYMASPVSMVAMPIQNALGVFQQVQYLGNATLVPANDSLRVLQAVESVPGAIAPTDAARIRELISAGNSGEALQRLAVYQNVLQLAQQECAAMPAAATLPLEQIAGLFGLLTYNVGHSPFAPPERYRPVSEAPPLAPAFASGVEMDFGGGHLRSFQLAAAGESPVLRLSLGRSGESNVILDHAAVSAHHAEISFWNGRYWLEDHRSTNGTYVNGRRLGAYEQVPLNDGDRIRIGAYEFVLKLPYARKLQDLETRLKDVAAYPEIFAVLEEAGFGDAAPKIREILLQRVGVNLRLGRLRGAIPYDGGLLLKLEAFLLRGEVVRLRSLFFPGKTPPQALEAGTRLAASLAQANSFADLADRLRRTNADAFSEWIEEIEKLQRFAMGYRAEDIRLDSFPDTFGLKAQVHRLFMEGLSLDSEQKQDLRYRGVTPDLLLERPWRKLTLSPLMANALEPFREAIGGRLNLKELDTTIVNSFGDENEAPEAQVDKVQGTRVVLYNQYQNNQPTGTLTESVTESRTPGFFDRVVDRLRNDRVPVLPTDHWLFGGTFHFDKRIEGRIYLSLRRRHAEAIFRYLSGVLEAGVRKKGAQVQYKIASHADGYSRSDSGVLYFHAKDQELIYRAVSEMSRAHPEFFKDGHPHFTLPLRDESGAVLPGLSFGEDPKFDHQSFGSKRTEAMTTAVRAARALMNTAEPPDWNEIRQICAYFLKRSGVDIESPAFEEGGRDRFGPLLAHCEAPTRAPQAPVVPVDREKMTELILGEILQRYPGLGVPAASNLVKSVAKLMYGTWEKSERFPGKSPEAPSYLPEDIFEARMADILKAVEKDRGKGHAHIDAFWEAIVTGDQGPRVLRGLVGTLKNRCPILSEPKSAGLVRSLAKSIHKAWLATPRSAEDLTEALRVRIAYLSAHLEKTASNDPFSLRLQAELQAFLTDL